MSRLIKCVVLLACMPLCSFAHDYVGVWQVDSYTMLYIEESTIVWLHTYSNEATMFIIDSIEYEDAGTHDCTIVGISTGGLLVHYFKGDILVGIGTLPIEGLLKADVYDIPVENFVEVRVTPDARRLK